MLDIDSLVRPDLRQLKGYTPIVPLDVLSNRLGIPVEHLVKLDANENPYGPSPHALAAIAGPQPYAIYPDPDQTSLRAALADYTGQSADRIVCGSGADEIIDLLMRLFVGPGDVVVEAPPTFGMYSFNTGVVGGRSVAVRRRDDFTLDVTEVVAVAQHEHAKLIFLPSPNNPDGSLLSREDVETLLRVPSIIVIDEAYAEFSGTTVLDLVAAHSNLVVLRTFSKWAGLAGLRIGYGVMDPTIVRYIMQIKPPYNINVAAQVAALASLADRQHLMTTVLHIIGERERLYAFLAGHDDLQVFPSHANFLLLRVGPQAGEVKRLLEQRGILVRYYDKLGLSDCIRVSIGRPEQNDLFMAALDAIMAGFQLAATPSHAS
ncbi:MAG: histidinol-phosphate transaminase [Herpetosiphon sp.]